MSVDRPHNARLTIRTAEDGMPSVKLNDMELSGLITNRGFYIRPGDDELPGTWVVSMEFGPGALELDLDIDLLTLLLEAAKDKA